MNRICMNRILICLLVIELASIKSAAYPQHIISLSLTKDNNISADGYLGPQLSGQCIDQAQCTHSPAHLILIKIWLFYSILITF